MLKTLSSLLLFPLALLAEETPLPQETHNFASEFTQMLSVLGMMIGALLLVAWVLKRIMNTRIQQINETSTIRILERRHLAPKSAIYLVEVEGKKIVIAESPAGIHPLTELEKEPAHEMV